MSTTGVRSRRARALVLRVLTCGALVAAVPGAAAHAAPAPDESPLRFATDAPIALADKPATVTVINASSAEWEVAVSTTLYTLEGAALALTTTAPRDLGPFKTAAIVIQPAPAGSPDASGVLLVTARSGATTVVLDTQVASGLPADTPVPGVTKWTGSSGGVMRGSQMPRVPLTAGTCDGVTASSVYLAANGRIAPLDYSCADVDGTPTITFTAAGVDQPGEYTGKLKVGATDVELKYVQSKHWLWAVGCLLLGFALAAANQAFATNTRPRWRANRRLNDIGRAVLTRQEQFERSAGSARYSAYTVVVGVMKEIARLQISLDDLRPTGFGRLLSWLFPFSKSDQEKALAEVVEEMAMLAEEVNAWPAHADDLAALTSRLIELDVVDPFDPGRLLPPPNPMFQAAPGVVVDAMKQIAPNSTSNGESPLDVEAMRALSASLAITVPTIDVVENHIKLRATLPDGPPDPARVDDSDRAVYFAARRLRDRIDAELREAPNAKAVQDASVDELAGELRALVLSLPGTERTFTPSSLPGHVEISNLVPTGLGGVVGAVVGLIPRLVRGAARVVSHGRQVELLWLAIALVAAIWSGLAALYVDKPWGSPTDIAAAIAWGLAATTALTPLLGALENLVAGPLRLEPAASAKSSDDAS